MKLKTTNLNAIHTQSTFTHTLYMIYPICNLFAMHVQHVFAILFCCRCIQVDVLLTMKTNRASEVIPLSWCGQIKWEGIYQTFVDVTVNQMKV